MKKLMFVLMALSGYWMASAQEIRESVNRLLVQDSVDATTIAGYDAPVRASTFEVATNPQIVANLNDLRLKTNNEFKNKLSTYPREVQQQLWNLARYEGLINELVSAGQLANETRRNLLAKYPDDIRTDAEDCVKNHFDALKDVNLTYNKFNEGFNAMIALLPGVTQKAFKDLLNYPDLLSLLSNNMNLTVRLGDFYHKDATVLVAAFDTLHNQLEAQKAKDLEDWKAAMQNDPDAAAEYQASLKNSEQHTVIQAIITIAPIRLLLNITCLCPMLTGAVTHGGTNTNAGILILTGIIGVLPIGADNLCGYRPQAGILCIGISVIRITTITTPT